MVVTITKAEVEKILTEVAKQTFSLSEDITAVEFDSVYSLKIERDGELPTVIEDKI